ncbi:hypothetical protein D9M69_518010 [compost metagenome]
MGESAPALPVLVDPEWQIIAHAQQAPGHVALPRHDRREDERPEETYFQCFARRHPTAPAGTTAQGVAGRDPVVVGQQADGVAAERMADPVEGEAILTCQIHGGCQVLVCPIQVGHVEALERLRPGLANAPVIQRDDVESLSCGVFGEAPVETLLDACRAGHDEVAPGISRRVVAIGGEPVAIAGGQIELFCLDVLSHVVRFRVHFTGFHPWRSVPAPSRPPALSWGGRHRDGNAWRP